MSNLATKTKQPKEFKRYLLTEDKAAIQAIDKGLTETFNAVANLETIFKTVTSGTAGMETVFNKDTINQMLSAANVREFVYDSVMGGKQMKAGNNFPISKQAGISMFDFHSDVDKLGSAIDKLKNLLRFFALIVFDEDGYHIDELKRIEQHERHKKYTDSEKISKAYEAALKVETAYNELIKLCMEDMNGNQSLRIVPFGGSLAWLDWHEVPTEKGVCQMVKLKPESFVNHGYPVSNHNLTDYLK